MKIAIVGAAGRMGRMLIAAVLAAEDAELAGGAEAAGHADMGRDLGELIGGENAGVAMTSNPRALFEIADVVIDFTVPTATAAHAGLAAEHGAALIIGTTGLDAAQQGAIDDAAAKTAIVQAANYSVGVNVLLGLVEKAAQILPDAYDIEVLEMHHHHKVDAPSGTALALGEAAAAGRDVRLDDVACKGRDGITGARRRGDIGFSAIRGGDIVGEHDVIFAADRERVILRHIATDPRRFARGAVQAAIWGQGRPPGEYDMMDVLGL